MTEKEAFKFAFLLECVSKGMTQSEIHNRIKQAKAELAGTAIEKEAAMPWALGAAGNLVGKGVSGVTNILKYILPQAVNVGLAGAIGLPILGGGALGYTAAKLTGGGGANAVEDAKKDETISEYDRLSEEAKRRSKIKALQQLTGRRIIALTPNQS